MNDECFRGSWVNFNKIASGVWGYPQETPSNIIQISAKSMDTKLFKFPVSSKQISSHFAVLVFNDLTSALGWPVSCHFVFIYRLIYLLTTKNLYSSFPWKILLFKKTTVKVEHIYSKLISSSSLDGKQHWFLKHSYFEKLWHSFAEVIPFFPLAIISNLYE